MHNISNQVNGVEREDLNAGVKGTRSVSPLLVAHCAFDFYSNEALVQ